MNGEQSLSLRDIARSSMKKRHIRTLGLIALVAVISFVIAGGTLLGVSLRNGIQNTEDRLGADLMVVPIGAERDYEGALLQGKPSTYFLDGGIADKIRSVQGVEHASPQLYIATFDSEHCAFPVQLIAYTPDSDFVIDPWLSAAVPGGPGLGDIVIGFNIQAKPGEDLKLFGTEYRIVGQLDKTGMGFDNTVFLNTETARALLADYAQYAESVPVPAGGNAFSVVAVDVEKGVDVGEFAKNFRETLRGDSVNVILSQEIISNISHNLSLTLNILTVMLVAVWLLAAIVLTIIFAVTLNERKRELGLYRALGATRTKLIGLVLSESAAIGIAGAAIGIGVTCLVVFPFNALIESKLKSEYLLPDSPVTALILLAAFAICAAMGPLSSAISAAGIGRQDVNSVIRDGA